jgi:putative flippase GtrA
MKETFKEVNRFIVVGIVSNVLNFVAYVFLYKIGIVIWIASIAGYIAGLVNSLYFGKTWVFNQGKIFNIQEIIKFVFIYGFGGLGMVFIINFLDNRTVLEYRTIWFFGATYAFLNNYLGSKIFVFSKGRR